MKLKLLPLIAALALAAAQQARADDAVEKPQPPEVQSPSDDGDHSGKTDGAVKPDDSELPEKPVIDNSGKSERPEKPTLPDRDNSGKHDAIKEIVAAFKAKAEEFHKQQTELNKSLSEATKEDRAKIRDQLKANRDTFAQLKQDFRDQVKDAASKLQEQKQKISEETKEKQNAHRGRSRD